MRTKAYADDGRSSELLAGTQLKQFHVALTQQLAEEIKKQKDLEK